MSDKTPRLEGKYTKITLLAESTPDGGAILHIDTEGAGDDLWTIHLLNTAIGQIIKAIREEQGGIDVS